MTDKGSVWFVRNVPAALRESVTTAAKARRLTVGELVTELLASGLERLESGQPAQNQVVDAGELAERLARLEQDFQQMQGAGRADGRNVWQQIEQLGERVATLEAAGTRQDASEAVPLPLHQETARTAPAPRPASSTASRKLPKGGRSLTPSEIEEVRRLRSEGESQGKIAAQFGVSQSLVSKVLQKKVTEPLPSEGTD